MSDESLVCCGKYSFIGVTHQLEDIYGKIPQTCISSTGRIAS